MNDAIRLSLGMLGINLLLPIGMSAVLQSNPGFLPQEVLFWGCVAVLVVLNLFLARQVESYRALFLAVGGLNVASSAIIGTLAFLPSAHRWIGVLTDGPQLASLW